MSAQNRTGAPISARRYAEFRDAAGSWTFEIRNYQSDLNAIVPTDVAPDPDPRESYRAAVFLEGFIQEQRSVANWSDDTLDQFDSFESTVEVEAVAKALREAGSRARQ
jgi:hypothetical protein